MSRSIRALFVSAVLTATGSSSFASDYGCRVLLCLSNPAGPYAVEQCRPSIDQLYRDLRAVPPKPFPTCEEAKGELTGSTSLSGYDLCPDGTTALAEGDYAFVSKSSSRAVYDQAASIYAGIGEGGPLIDPDTQGPPKICVGNSLGTVDVATQDGASIRAMAYDRIATVTATPGIGRFIDIYIQGKQYRRIRY